VDKYGGEEEESGKCKNRKRGWQRVLTGSPKMSKNALDPPYPAKSIKPLIKDESKEYLSFLPTTIISNTRRLIINAVPRSLLLSFEKKIWHTLSSFQ
jgi:hypothetical protein